MAVVDNGDGTWKVINPDLGIEQSFDPVTRAAFDSEVAAQAYEDGLIAQKAANDAARADAYNAMKAAELHLEIAPDVTMAAVGNIINIVATVRNGLGAVVTDFTGVFAVPVVDEDGDVVMLKGVTFTSGVANVSLSLPSSGYYSITERMINSKLVGMYLHLGASITFTIYE